MTDRLDNHDDMRVLSEPPAPLDPSGELRLDTELRELASQLGADAQRVASAARLEQTLAAEESLGEVGRQLSADASRIAAAALGPPQAASPQSSRRMHRWVQAALRIAPIAAATLLAMRLALPPQPPPQPPSRPAPAEAPRAIGPRAIGPRAIGPRATAPSAPFGDTSRAGTSRAGEVIPAWEQLSSPELDGVLDLVDGPVEISI